LWIRSDQVEKYLEVFLTTDRTLRKSVVTKGFVRDNPAIGRLFEAEVKRVWPLIEKGTAASVWELWREALERGQLRVVS